MTTGTIQQALREYHQASPWRRRDASSLQVLEAREVTIHQLRLTATSERRSVSLQPYTRSHGQIVRAVDPWAIPLRHPDTSTQKRVMRTLDHLVVRLQCERCGCGLPDCQVIFGGYCPVCWERNASACPDCYGKRWQDYEPTAWSDIVNRQFLAAATADSVPNDVQACLTAELDESSPVAVHHGAPIDPASLSPTASHYRDAKTSALERCARDLLQQAHPHSEERLMSQQLEIRLVRCWALRLAEVGELVLFGEPWKVRPRGALATRVGKVLGGG